MAAALELHSSVGHHNTFEHFERILEHNGVTLRPLEQELLLQSLRQGCGQSMSSEKQDTDDTSAFIRIPSDVPGHGETGQARGKTKKVEKMVRFKSSQGKSTCSLSCTC